MDPLESYKRAHTTVPGWFHAVDLALFELVDASQRATGVQGSMLEIGAYQGASAILLGFLVDEPTDLVVCDLFESAPEGEPSAGRSRADANVAENATYYSDLAQRTFEANYRRFHASLPHIRRCSSTDLRPESLGPMRLVHIDGSHLYDFVRDDLLLSRELLVDGGIVIVDDYRSEHAPGPGAAAWEAVANDGLIPLCITPYKLYGYWSAHRVGAVLADRLHAHPSLLTTDVEVGAHRVVRAMAPPDLYSAHLRRQRRIRRYVPPVAFDVSRRLRHALHRTS